MNKMKITKKTYDKNVKKFAIHQVNIWNKLQNFMDILEIPNQKRNTLYEIIDNYIFLNDDIMNYAIKNNINKKNFMRDIDNMSEF